MNLTIAKIHLVLHSKNTKKYAPKNFYILNISQNRSLLSLVNIKLLNLLNNNLLLQERTIPTATLHLHIDK